MDIFTKTYLNTVNEWNSYRKPQQNPKSYSLADVAIAVKNATNDFKDNWEKGYTGRAVFRELENMEENGTSNFDEGQMLVLKAYEHWDDKNDEFAILVKDAFRSMDCPSDKVGLFAYAIWQGVKVANFNESGAGDVFKIGEKVDLILTYFDDYESTFNYGRMKGYRNSYLYHDQTAIHYLCTCDKYLNVVFDIVFQKNNNWSNVMEKHSDFLEEHDRDIDSMDLRHGDKINISAKVKKIDSRSSTVSLNYGKILDVVEFSKSES